MVEQFAKKGLQSDILKARVAEKCHVGMSVVVHQSIDSTNNWSLQQSKAGRSLPFACFAEQQTHGKGRRGKHWFMPAYSNIAMSIVWPFDLSRQALHLLPLSVALAIADTLESFKLRQVQIKWPNDVYVDGKKIAGILIETQPLKKTSIGEQQTAVVIGIGVNYDMSSLSETGLPDFTDIVDEINIQEIKCRPGRTDVASMLLKNVVDVCQNFPEKSKQYLERYRAQYDYCRAKNVQLILDNNEVVSGIAQGVNDEAELVVMVEGKKCVFNSAEVSVRASKESVV